MKRRFTLAAVTLASVAALAAGCVAAPAFVCQSNDGCVSTANAQGICESNHVCSFPDVTCKDTSRRYAAGASATGCVPAPAAKCVGQVVLGTDHVCALRTSDGAVFCWGANDKGQLGDGTKTNRGAPAQVKGLPGRVTAISTAEGFSCALLADASVWCWGANDKGQLGIGPTPTESLAPIAVQLVTSAGPPEVTAPLKAAAISSGGGHTCAITDTGKAACWGENQVGMHGGQSGQDPTVHDDVRTAMIVSGSPDGLDEISVGDEYSCAHKDDKTVQCWGVNQQGELGNGQTTDSFSPVQVEGLTSVKHVVAADESACVVKDDSSVLCWGYGGSGSIGNGQLADQHLPVPVTNAAAIGGGGTSFTVCAIAPGTSGGTLQCWGENSKGQAASSEAVPRYPAPHAARLTTVQAVATGQNNGCATTVDGALWCWGDNTSGQLGNGNTLSSLTPVLVPSFCQ